MFAPALGIDLGGTKIEGVVMDEAGNERPRQRVATPRDELAATHANGGTIGFKAATAAQVDAWHAAALAHGGACEGPPGPREYGAVPLYGAYARDPEGNKLCVFTVLQEGAPSS